MRSLHHLFALTLVMTGTGLSSASPGSEAGAGEAGGRLGRRAGRPDTVEQLMRRHPKGPVPLQPRGSQGAEEVQKRGHAAPGSRDHAFSKRMAHQNMKQGIMKDVRVRRYEGDAVEKRWIQGPSIIQDSTPTEGLPPPGANVNYFNPALPSGTPGGGARLVPPTFAPLPTPNLPLPGLNTVPAAFQSASTSYRTAAVPTNTPSAVDLQLAAVSPTSAFADASAAAAIGDALKHMLDPAVASPTTVTQKAKRWVRGNSILQDDSPSSGLPNPGGGNVNNFPGYVGNSMGRGGGPSILTPPTFPGLPPQASNGLNGLNQVAVKTMTTPVMQAKPKTSTKAAVALGARPTTTKAAAAVRTQVGSSKLAKREESARQIRELQRRAKEVEQEEERSGEEYFEAEDELWYEYDEVPVPEDDWHEDE
ncbi:BQ2448_7838 [Microbotryum intermedium]|uniref:BQ2448_7838 protein n=1 Tax=Microbotryum intermedium TaxID=269621 RepID=A0A238FPW3_9BASI|nr:BQ2448_7838 [Microbotryum intermedium]